MKWIYILRLYNLRTDEEIVYMKGMNSMLGVLTFLLSEYQKALHVVSQSNVHAHVTSMCAGSSPPNPSPIDFDKK